MVPPARQGRAVAVLPRWLRGWVLLADQAAVCRRDRDVQAFEASDFFVKAADAGHELRFAGGRGREIPVPHRLIPGCADLEVHATRQVTAGDLLAFGDPGLLDGGDLRAA